MVAVVVAAASLAVLAGREGRAQTRMLAFPAAFREAAVLEALAGAGIDDVVSASTTLVPLSDFSRVVPVPFVNADLRAPGGDPRRTPLLDELGRRFSVPGPDAEPWRVIYVPAPDEARDEIAARVLSGFGSSWAWDAGGRGAASGAAPRFLWVPAVAWAVWLVAGKPRRGWPGRLLCAVSWVPLLGRPTPAAALLFVALDAAATVADRYMVSRAPRRSFLVLWTYAAAVLVLPALDPGVVPYLAVSVALFMVQLKFRPALERLARRARLHEPPVFRVLTLNAASDNARRTVRALVVPAVVILASAAMAPARSGSEVVNAPAYRVERAAAVQGFDADRMLREHAAFQVAITFGRIGDAAWGDDSYAPAYRYREEDGRMRRVADAQKAEPAWSSDAFRSALLALSGPEPAFILPLLDNGSTKAGSALP